MDVLNKTIKKLTDKEYQDLLSAVAGRKNNKPYLVLETARKHNFDEGQMMELLGVNPSTYYTLKSRLNEKIAEYFSRNIQNPISSLKEKVALVPAMMFGNNRDVALRALKNLEKQLVEYDLSNELIVVYKAMARLSMYNGDFDFYEKEYNRHVAYSLAVVKAEDLFYEFVKCTGMYLLTRDARDLDAIQTVMRELTNISELYVGHRLFVYYNIVRLYNLCIVTTRPENLKSIELEVESILNQISKHFETYDLDTFYQSIKFLVDFLNFEYYTKTGNLVRAELYYQRINKNLPDIAIKPVFSFYVAQFLNSKIDRFVQNGNVEELTDINVTLENCVDFDMNDPYPYITFKKFLAIGKFYQADYAGSARIVNSLRNDMSLKKYLFTDIECKLFQALQYCIQGDDALCGQILQSVKRQVNEEDEIFESARIFIKMLKTATKPEEFRRKLKKLTEMWEAFQAANTGNRRILAFIKLDESMIRKMGNPIKN